MRDESWNNFYRKFFLGHILTDILSHNCKIIFENKEKVVIDKKIKSSACWDDDLKTLSIGIRKPFSRWYRNFIHEYCHFLQWKEKDKIWKYYDKITRKYNSDDWIVGRNFSKKQINLMIDANVIIELDCEKRVIELIKEYHLPFKIDNEIQEMNAYLYFISSVRVLRKWYKKAPYEVKEIVREMPEEFQKSYKKLPDKFLYLVKKYCL